jgi:hypothetical protein
LGWRRFANIRPERKLDHATKEAAMARVLTGYLAGAAFALTAAAAVAAYAQAGAPASAADQAVAQAKGDASKEVRIYRREAGPGDPAARTERREERRIIIGDGDHEFAFDGHGRHADMGEHLRTMLQLKPGQEPALQTYLAAVRPQHADGEHMTHMADRDGDKAKTTPERLADMEKRMADQQAAAHARIEATRKFYAQLEPSQKKVFDEMPMLMVGPIGPIGPMMLPGPMKIRFEHPPMPPLPPLPPAAPVPPAPPAPPRS